MLLTILTTRSKPTPITAGSTFPGSNVTFVIFIFAMTHEVAVISEKMETILRRTVFDSCMILYKSIKDSYAAKLTMHGVPTC